MFILNTYLNGTLNSRVRLLLQAQIKSNLHKFELFCFYSKYLCTRAQSYNKTLAMCEISRANTLYEDILSNQILLFKAPTKGRQWLILRKTRRSKYVSPDVFQYMQYCWTKRNLTKVRPPFMISHMRSDNSLLLIMFSANYISQSNCDFYVTEVISEVLTFWS